MVIGSTIHILPKIKLRAQRLDGYNVFPSSDEHRRQS